MADLQRVPVNRPLPKSWLPTLLSALGFLVALAIVKPWEDRSAPSVASTSIVSPAPPSAVPTPRVVRSAYDPRLFGFREPDPAWELWPAGYVVEFGIAGPLPVGGQGAASASPMPTDAPEPPVGASPDAPPEPGASAGPAADAHVVDLGPTDHLVALGINTPADVRVERIALWLSTGAPCCPEAVPILRLPTLWDSRHFLVIGVADVAQPHLPGDWAPGEYRLALTTVTGDVRSVRFRVAAPVG
jgi:hypothetical protein